MFKDVSNVFFVHVCVRGATHEEEKKCIYMYDIFVVLIFIVHML